jgi:hypothetical protein
MATDDAAPADTEPAPATEHPSSTPPAGGRTRCAYIDDPCPLGDACPDARKFGEVHPAPPSSTDSDLPLTERLDLAEKCREAIAVVLDSVFDSLTGPDQTAARALVEVAQNELTRAGYSLRAAREALLATEKP